jgi:hypothetical protein
MLNLQEISDRLEIQQMLIDYANAIDASNFDELDRLFAADAFIDHSANGSYVGPYPGFKDYVRNALSRFTHYYHLVSNIAVAIAGDTATARCVCLNPIDVPLPGGTNQVMFIGFWYHTELVRTADGWRFSRRVQQGCFQHNIPGAIKLPLPNPKS